MGAIRAQRHPDKTSACGNGGNRVSLERAPGTDHLTARSHHGLQEFFDEGGGTIPHHDAGRIPILIGRERGGELRAGHIGIAVERPAVIDSGRERGGHRRSGREGNFVAGELDAIGVARAFPGNVAGQIG